MCDDCLVGEEPSGTKEGAFWFKKLLDALSGVSDSGTISKEASLAENAQGIIVLADAGEPVGGRKRG